MTAAPHTAPRTGGPWEGDGLVEHLLGWTLAVLLAVFVTRAGLM